MPRLASALPPLLLLACAPAPRAASSPCAALPTPLPALLRADVPPGHTAGLPASLNGLGPAVACLAMGAPPSQPPAPPSACSRSTPGSARPTSACS